MFRYVNRPFTRRIAELRTQHKYGYADLAEKCHNVRSSTWIYSLLRSNDPWDFEPPRKEMLGGFAALMQTPRERVAEMIAEEWYGVKFSEQSDRVRSLASRLDELNDDDAKLVEALVQRLQPPTNDLMFKIEE